MRYLPDHARDLSSWIDLAEQVVVVDSFSRDGTVEFLKQNLRHPNIRFEDHPPGLYASWNHGIRQLATEFSYISTVGDSLTRDGIQHLVSAAARLQSDVLVSRPDFVDEDGLSCDGPEWPMDDVIRRLQIREPRRLPPAIVLAAALTRTGGAVTGSCASDLFRTAVLQKHPFPTDFGVSGDFAWSLENAGRIRWAVTPQKTGIFRRHPSAASIRDVEAGKPDDRFPEMAADTVSKWLGDCPADVSDEIRSCMKQLLAVSIEHEELRRRHNARRKNKWPWILNPAAWRARTRRNRLKPEIDSLMQRICTQA